MVTKIDGPAYLLRRYTARDTIVMQGTYDDSLLRVPNGKFIYYKKEKDVPIALKEKVHINTDNYIQLVGFFLNGEKTDMWVTYAKKGVKAFSNTYEHGKLNGLSQYYHFNRDTVVDEEGYFTNDQKEGEWKTYDYNLNGKPTTSDIYLRGKLVQHIEHYKDLPISQLLNSYLIKKFDILLSKARITTIRLSFTINAKGEMVDVKVDSLIEKLSEATVVQALSAPPLSVPALYDNVPISKRFNFMYSIEKGSSFVMTSVEKIGT